MWLRIMCHRSIRFKPHRHLTALIAGTWLKWRLVPKMNKCQVSAERCFNFVDRIQSKTIWLYRSDIKYWQKCPSEPYRLILDCLNQRVCTGYSRHIAKRLFKVLDKLRSMLIYPKVLQGLFRYMAMSESNRLPEMPWINAPMR